MTSATGVADVGSDMTTAGTDSTVLATVATAYVIGSTTFDTGATGSVAAAFVTGALSFEFDSSGVVVAGVTPDPFLSDTVSADWGPVVESFAPADCWPGFPSEPSVRVRPRTVCRTVVCRLFAAVAVELLAELALWLGPSTPWLLGAEPLAPGSAAAIAAPALPMRRPAKSTQAPATERRTVEMGSSSQKKRELVA